ncbi:M16 family metallopeptidase [Coraliomargarita parva]|uniref:M16 family metallopeptidase n=1 Tax=Coraliomargarita parva TaxID=3014050 RepID=UPI0022B56761|nr:pitrilysin family protein [Coraliomargarita parva]
MSDYQFSSEDAHSLVERLYQVPAERHVLENGLTLVHRPDFSSEVVSVQVWIKTGSIHEGPLLGSGLSHYLEHLLFKGTARRDAKSISREVHALGGGINAYTTFDRTVYYIDGPSASFAQAADVLSDIVFHSLLPEAEVARERDVILREIDMGLDDPDRQLMQALFRTAYQKHPYREPVIGHRPLFEQVSRDELYAYYRARYVPNNAVVSVVGAVSREDCLSMIREKFGSLTRGRLAPAPLEAESQQLAGRADFIQGDFKVYRGSIAYQVPHLSHPDSPRLDALAHALGGGESSVLWQVLRNQKKLVHYIDCRNWNPGTRGLFWISYVCDPDKASQAETAIFECIDCVIRDGLDAKVVEKARRQALSSEINGRKTMSGQASRLGLAEVVLGDLKYGRRYLTRLNEVSAGELQAVAGNYLQAATCSRVGLGPEASRPVSGELPSEAMRPSPFEEVSLASGGRILLQPDARLPKVHIRAVMLGGPCYEAAGQRGVSAIMAELMTLDTKSRTAEEIASRIESVGGSFSAHVGNNTVSLAIEVLPGDLPLALELLEGALTEPLFLQDAFETEVEAQVSHLHETDDDLLDFGFRRLRECFFGPHAFAVGADGKVEDLESLSRDQVEAQFRKLVCRGNLVLSVCGDFDRGHVFEALQVLLEQRVAPGMLEPAVPAERFGPEQPVRQVDVKEREQAVVLQGYPDVGILSEDYVTAEVLNELFSGMSSRLFERVREDRGMAYYVGSTRVLGLHESMFVLYAGTHPDQAEEVIKEMDGEIARVAAGDVLEVELDRCRTRLKSARVMGRQTIGARAMHAAVQSRYGLPLNDDAEFEVKLDAVNPEVLAAFVRKYLRPDRQVQLLVRP